MKKNVKQALCFWGLQGREVKQIYDTAWQVGEEYVLKVYRKREKLEVSEAEKETVPSVMECIELLFVAYFESIKDVQCAEDAYKIFEFVRQREERIRKSVG